MSAKADYVDDTTVGVPAVQIFETPADMNRFERRPPSLGEAVLQYLDGEYRVVRPGGFVLCAVTGRQIPLEELRYWSVDRQEAYSSPEAIMVRLGVRKEA